MCCPQRNLFFPVINAYVNLPANMYSTSREFLHTFFNSLLHIIISIRRNWKDRFFVLKQDKTLCYYDTSDYHSAKPQKTIELSQVINLIDGGSKEHAFGIETAERTYYITAASSEEKR